MTDEHCEIIDGARVRISDDATDADRAAISDIVAAAKRYMADREAAPYVSDMDVRERITPFLLTAEAIDAWMASPFPNGPLRGKSATQWVLEGRGQDVLDFIAAMEDGVFM